MNDSLKDSFDYYVDDLKYYGILKNHNLEILNDSLIKTLLEKNIIVFSREYPFETDTKFKNRINYKGKCYKLSYEVQHEIFKLIDFHFDFRENQHFIEIDIEQLNFDLQRFLDIEDKITFLKRKYSEVFPDHIWYDSYNEYLIKYKNNQSAEYELDEHLLYQEYPGKNYSDWESFVWGVFSKEIIIWYLTEDLNEVHSLDIENPFFHKIYGIEIVQSYPKLFEMVELWQEFHLKKGVLKYIKSKIEELEKEINNTAQNNTSTNKLSALEVAYYIYYKREAKEKVAEVPFPSEMAFKELQDEWGPNWKNIQKEYNLIFKDRDIRLKPGRDKKIQRIKHLLTPTALSIAESDLINI